MGLEPEAQAAEAAARGARGRGADDRGRPRAAGQRGAAGDGRVPAGEHGGRGGARDLRAGGAAGGEELPDAAGEQADAHGRPHVRAVRAEEEGHAVRDLLLAVPRGACFARSLANVILGGCIGDAKVIFIFTHIIFIHIIFTNFIIQFKFCFNDNPIFTIFIRILKKKID